MMAHELFEKLGYLRELNDDYIVYVERGNPWNYFKFVNKCVMFPSQNGLSYSTISPRFAKAIYMQMKELGWIRSEPEKRLETNYEHYKDEIVRFFINDIARVNGRFALCNGVNCSECDFHDASSKGDCIAAIENWLKLKHTYRLTRFEYDLLRTNTESKDKTFNDFATYKNLRSVGYFRGIDFELKIDDVLANCEVIQ